MFSFIALIGFCGIFVLMSSLSRVISKQSKSVLHKKTVIVWVVGWLTGEGGRLGAD